jgi:hypothetical protein
MSGDIGAYRAMTETRGALEIERHCGLEETNERVDPMEFGG